MNKYNYYTIFEKRTNVQFDQCFTYGFLIEEMYINTISTYVDNRFINSF
jgi:hypothetical protein